MAGHDDSGSNSSRQIRPSYEEAPTRPHQRPVQFVQQMAPTIKLDPIPVEMTLEMDVTDGEYLEVVPIGNDEATEMLARDEVLRRIKSDRGVAEENYEMATVRMEAIHVQTRGERPSTRVQPSREDDLHLRATVEAGADHGEWVEFVCEVDRNGSLVMPIEMVHSRAFRPGRRVLVRAYVLDE
jgi:hypothetical protein